MSSPDPLDSSSVSVFPRAPFSSSSSPSSDYSVAELSSAFELNSSTPSSSGQLIDLFDACLKKLLSLRDIERQLSQSAGQLLKALQSEETLVNQLSTTLKRIRHEHKKLLARIANPRWEIKHHYHMTCMEHSLGHRQPHVMDVAEMLPGHLRYYALARTHAILKRTLTHSSQRAKSERNSAADQIKEAYRKLREVRQNIKEVQKMIEAMQAKFHLLPNEERTRLESIIKAHRKAAAAQSAGAHRLGPAGDQRLRYLKSLNLAPPRMFDQSGSSRSEQEIQEERQRVMETANQDWKAMNQLLSTLTSEAEQKSAGDEDHELNRLMHIKRKRIGIDSLPKPIAFGAIANHNANDNGEPFKGDSSDVELSEAEDESEADASELAALDALKLRDSESDTDTEQESKLS